MTKVFIAFGLVWGLTVSATIGTRNSAITPAYTDCGSLCSYDCGGLCD